MRKLIIEIIVVSILVVIVPVVYASIFDLGNYGKIPAVKIPKQIEKMFHAEDEIDTLKEAANYIQAEMIERKEIIEFTYRPHEDFSGDASEFWEELEPYVFAETSNPKGGDYLEYHCSHINLSMQGDMSEVVVKVVVGYNSSARDEQAVDVKVDEIMDSLDLSSKSDYEKISLIYEYLKTNVVYSKTENMFTAYGALIDGKCVCQGYALAFYRLCREVGIECVCITGTSNGEPHMWNAVNLNGKYYLCDVTWDSQNNSNMFFLKGEKDFPDHVPDEDYQRS